MKILNLNDFINEAHLASDPISERIKVQPITNTEWDKIRKETLVELPLKHENMLTLGNVITIKTTEYSGSKYIAASNEVSETDYIVTLKEYAPVKIPKDVKEVLVSYKLYADHVSYWVDFFDNFKPTFPKLDILDVCEFEVTNIRGTLPDYILRNMKDINYLKHVYDKYHLACYI